MLLIYAVTERVIGLINKKTRNCLEYIYFIICVWCVCPHVHGAFRGLEEVVRSLGTGVSCKLQCDW